jgi:hypothetical protein
MVHKRPHLEVFVLPKRKLAIFLIYSYDLLIGSRLVEVGVLGLNCGLDEREILQAFGWVSLCFMVSEVMMFF